MGFIIFSIISNVIKNDITTSIRLIEDECNIYTMLNAIRVSRAKESIIDLARC